MAIRSLHVVMTVLMSTLGIFNIDGFKEKHRYCSSYPELYFANIAGKIKGGIDIFKGVNERPCSLRTHEERRYREVDGRCNNFNDYGSTFKPVKRYLRPHYQDKHGLNSPRIYSVDGSYLPSPRLVSWKLHPDDSYKDNHTMLVLQVGQLLDHDITSAPVPTETNSSIKCCGISIRDMPDICFPIPIPRDDPNFKIPCMEFVRSEPAHDEDGKIIYPREQLNALTSFVDGSCFYGSSEDTNIKLRSDNGKGALLKTRYVHGKERLPADKESECLESGTRTSYCQLAGDSRVNEHPYLGTLHTAFHLSHNRLVRQLVKRKLQLRGYVNIPQSMIENFLYSMSHYRKEKLYKVARKINEGIWQKIIYCDWLPIILGPDLIHKFKLGCDERSEYNPFVDPRIANSFLTAAFRFGHSLIPNKVKINHRLVELKTQFMIPDNSLRYYDTNLEGMTEKGSQEVLDRFVSKSVTEHLFEPGLDKEGALDLVALNIQRGRDHGIPGYYWWTLYYNLERPKSFKNFTHGKDLSKLYKHILDIDLFPGGLMEAPVAGGMVGPTFGHIIANQFADLKFGDSHFFLSKEYPQGFTTAQLKEIRSMTIEDVLCQNSDLKQLQRNAFYEPSNKNPLIPCSSRPELDVTPWMAYW